MKLSIVATLYKSAPYIHEFVERSCKVAEELVAESYEIILVNDGSPDDSLEIAVKLTQGNSHVVVVDLSRNFGHHKAMMTGLSKAAGELIFLIDSDLEEEPEWLVGFSEKMAKEGCDVVYGIQDQRRGSFFERVSGTWFYKAIRYFSALEIPENLTTVRLMSRRYVDALIKHTEREVFLAGLWYLTGFEQRSQVVRKRKKDSTTYTLNKKITLLVNSITAFSTLPLISMFYIGLLITGTSLVYTAYIIGRWLFADQPLVGWTSLMASVWLIGGTIVSFVGIIGIYLSKIYSEVKQRPYTIVRQVIKKSETEVISLHRGQ